VSDLRTLKPTERKNLKNLKPKNFFLKNLGFFSPLVANGNRLSITLASHV